MTKDGCGRGDAALGVRWKDIVTVARKWGTLIMQENGNRKNPFRSLTSDDYRIIYSGIQHENEWCCLFESDDKSETEQKFTKYRSLHWWKEHKEHKSHSFHRTVNVV